MPSLLADRAVLQEPQPAPWDAVRLEVTRDTWVSSVPGERHANLGGADRLKFKGIQEFSLIDINTLPIRRRVIKAATLHLRRRSAPILRRVTVSTITSPWAQGTSLKYRPQQGAASFLWAAQGQFAWAYRGSDVTAVINGMGHSIWGFADASSPDSQGWQVIPVLPRVVAARVAGISHGFAAMDDVGSEYQHNGTSFHHDLFPNRFVYSIEAREKYAPYMTVFLGAADESGPYSVGRIESSTDEDWLQPGEAIVSWTTPADVGPAGTLGFHVQVGAISTEQGADATIRVPTYLVPPVPPAPQAAAPGQIVKMHLRDLGLAPDSVVAVRVRAVDAAGNLGPISTGLVQLAPPRGNIPLQDAPPTTPLSQELPVDAADQAPTFFVVDLLDKVHPKTGRMIPVQKANYRINNHLWSAGERRVRLFAARNEFVAFQLVLADTHEPSLIELKFQSATKIQAGDPSPNDPTGESGAKPSPPVAPTTRFATDSPTARIWRSEYVSTKNGPLPDPLIALDGPQSGHDPDRKHPMKYRSYIVDVYVPHQASSGLHQGILRVRIGDRTIELAVDLRVWRFTLSDFLSFIPQMNCYGLPNPPGELGYYRLAHEHRTALNRLPYNWRGQVRSDIAPRWHDDHVNWDAFDHRFGPLLDGSAFADLPRRGVPVDAFYLPINENWPMDIHAAFQDSYWADRALPEQYWQQLAEASRRFAEHFDKKRWFNTFFEFYLNNKIYFKKDDWNAGSAPWIFDEPVNTQDFWALRQYGRAFHAGVASVRGRAKMVFRCDISRPQWQRDLLDGVLDVNVVGGAFRAYGRRVMDKKHLHQQIVYEYGGVNPIEQSNVQPAVWCIDAWARGADGVLPWQTIGSTKSWERADSQALFYPGGPVGSSDPIPSVRLKAFRRGQQDVEYLVMLSGVLDLPRSAVGRWVAEQLKLAGHFRTRGGEDAGLVSYAGLSPEALWSLRTRVGALLDQSATPLKRRWVHLRTPNRDPNAITDTRYFAPLPAAVHDAMNRSDPHPPEPGTAAGNPN